MTRSLHCSETNHYIILTPNANSHSPLHSTIRPHNPAHTHSNIHHQTYTNTSSNTTRAPLCVHACVQTKFGARCRAWNIAPYNPEAPPCVQLRLDETRRSPPADAGLITDRKSVLEYVERASPESVTVAGNDEYFAIFYAAGSIVTWKCASRT